MVAVLAGGVTIGLAEVLGEPDRSATILRRSVFGLTEAQVAHADSGCVVLWLTLEPWRPLAAEGYPTEQVSIGIWDNGRMVAVPHRADRRSWLHRQPTLLGELCLWYRRDPRPLRWEWADGIVRYVTIVHRHLQAEEFWRRNGYWPSEDAPHGDGPAPHPIRTVAMQRAAQRWHLR